MKTCINRKKEITANPLDQYFSKSKSSAPQLKHSQSASTAVVPDDTSVIIPAETTTSTSSVADEMLTVVTDKAALTVEVSTESSGVPDHTSCQPDNTTTSTSAIADERHIIARSSVLGDGSSCDLPSVTTGGECEAEDEVKESNQVFRVAPPIMEK